MSPTNYVEVAVALLLLMGAAFAIYQYVRKHPEALAAFEARLKLVEATAQTDLKAALSRIELALGMIHTAVQNPTQVVVTGTPMPLPPAVAAPVVTEKPVVDAPPSAAAPAAKPFDPAVFEGAKAIAPAGTAAAPTTAAPAVPFDPVAWGRGFGSHYDYTSYDGSPVSFNTIITKGPKDLGCGAGSMMDATPEITANGVILMKGYGRMNLASDTPCTVTIKFNKTPCQVSVGLMGG